MVLLDSEGIGDTSSEERGDRQIFTLTVLLASLLIYNSHGVPERRDKEQLEYPLLELSEKDLYALQNRSQSTNTEVGPEMNSQWLLFYLVTMK